MINELTIVCWTGEKQQLANPKSVTDSSAVVDAAKALLSAAGFGSSDVDVALDAIKTAKIQNQLQSAR